MNAVVYRCPTTKQSGSELPAEAHQITIARTPVRESRSAINDFHSLNPRAAEVLGANEQKSASQKFRGQINGGFNERLHSRVQ